MEKRRVKWKDWLQYVIDNIENKKLEEIAEHIGAKKLTLISQLSVWRKEGHPIKIVKGKMPEGTIVHRTKGRYIKKGGKWVLLDCKGRNKPLSEWHKQRIREGIKAARKANKPVKQVVEKKEPKRLPDRVITELTKRVQVSRNTWIMVPVDANEQEVIRKYQSKYCKL